MRTINDTITRLAAIRGRGVLPHPAPGEDRLGDLTGFGSNPGALRARRYVPDQLPCGRPLVVVLHGCTQSAAGYDHGSGWSALADEHGFAVLFPEQQRANNPNLCFNWFVPDDIRRGSGETLSIRQMVATMIAAHALDPTRVYVTGLSAGGAMASVLLATYPEVFAGGAIIAGLPFGTATSIPEAFDRMRGSGSPDGPTMGERVRSASDHQGPWPVVSVWHGDSDATVSDANAAHIIDQWRHVHGLAATPTITERISGCPRRVWRDADGRDVIEAYSIAGTGHGTPIDTVGEDGCGAAGPYMLEAGISSTRRIAAFWGLCALTAAPGVARQEAADETRSAVSQPPADGRPTKPGPLRSEPGSVQRSIETALRAAGLLT